jgi:hypothetical protein
VVRLPAFVLALVILPACPHPRAVVSGLSLDDEAAFRLLREDFHRAQTTGDADLLRSLLADDAVLTTGDGTLLVGPDEITGFLAGDPHFGNSVVLTSESHWDVEVDGSAARYGFESIAVDLGGADPAATPLALPGGQNPAVQIVEHTHSTGSAARTAEGRWVLTEIRAEHGPLPPTTGDAPADASGPAATSPDLDDAVAFRRLRETFHLANITGDKELMRTVWADGAVFTTGAGVVYEGGDVITDFFAGTAAFGRLLVVTPENSAYVVVDGDTAEYGFECIAIDVGLEDPASIVLCSSDGAQNPFVEIVRHTHSTGHARRVGPGRWVFTEFNGGSGPLPPRAE